MAIGPWGGIRLRPLDIGDVLDETFRVYRRQFLPLVTTMAVVVAPAALVTLAVTLATGFSGPAITRAVQERGDPTALIVGGVVIFLLSVVTGIIHLAAVGAATLIAAGAILGQSIGVGEAYRRAFSHFGSLFSVGFAAGLPVALLICTCLGIPIAIFVGLGWSLVSPVILLEGRGPIEAMRRSWELVRGHRWRLLACWLLIGLIVYLLVSIPSGLFSFLWTILLGLNGSSPGLAMLVQAGNVIFSAVGQVLFGAVVYITAALLYYDLRIRKEAFDLEQRLPLPEPPPVAPRVSYPDPPLA